MLFYSLLNFTKYQVLFIFSPVALGISNKFSFTLTESYILAYYLITIDLTNTRLANIVLVSLVLSALLLLSTVENML